MQEYVVPYPEITTQLQNAIKKHRLDLLIFCVRVLLGCWFEISWDFFLVEINDPGQVRFQVI